VEEGEEDEMFWMFLGEDDYANADHWKWRKTSALSGSENHARIWRIDDDGRKIEELHTFPPSSVAITSVFVVYLIFENFVIVGPRATTTSGSRKGRHCELQAISFAQSISAHTENERPFKPPVHVLTPPSRVPVDLCAAVRGLQEESLHDCDTPAPDHMSLLTVEEALGQA